MEKQRFQLFHKKTFRSKTASRVDSSDVSPEANRDTASLTNSLKCPCFCAECAAEGNFRML
jgi:hypothetical protein